MAKGLLKTQKSQVHLPSNLPQSRIFLVGLV
jgi:hypothetical protein